MTKDVKKSQDKLTKMVGPNSAKHEKEGQRLHKVLKIRTKGDYNQRKACNVF